MQPISVRLLFLFSVAGVIARINCIAMAHAIGEKNEQLKETPTSRILESGNAM
jgi:hypothetical protein